MKQIVKQFKNKLYRMNKKDLKRDTFFFNYVQDCNNIKPDFDKLIAMCKKEFGNNFKDLSMAIHKKSGEVRILILKY